MRVAAGSRAHVPRFAQPDQDDGVDTPPQAVEAPVRTAGVHAIHHQRVTLQIRVARAGREGLQFENFSGKHILHEVYVEGIQPHITRHRGVREANDSAARATAGTTAEQHHAEEEIAPREQEDVEPTPLSRCVKTTVMHPA